MSKGYTMIEITIATGIFAVLVVLFVGIFSRFVSVQDRGVSEQGMQEELRSALEIMNREIRTGYGSTYDVSDSSGRGVIFRNQNGICVHYVWQNAGLERSETNTFASQCAPNVFSGLQYASLTSSATQVTHARFDVVRAEQVGDELKNQGVVTLVLEAESAQADAAPFQLQSTVASRQVIPFPSL